MSALILTRKVLEIKDKVINARINMEGQKEGLSGPGDEDSIDYMWRDYNIEWLDERIPVVEEAEKKLLNLRKKIEKGLKIKYIIIRIERTRHILEGIRHSITGQKGGLTAQFDSDESSLDSEWRARTIELISIQKDSIAAEIDKLYDIELDLEEENQEIIIRIK